MLFTLGHFFFENITTKTLENGKWSIGCRTIIEIQMEQNSINVEMSKR